MTTIFAIITGAGKGSRLFPVSSEKNSFSLFQKAFLTLTECIDDKNIITVTQNSFFSSVNNQLKELKNKFSRKTGYKYLVFPEEKGTGVETATGTKYVSDNLNFTNKDAVILTFPGENIIISDRKAFASYVEKGTKLAKEGYIVSFAMNPEKNNKDTKYLKARKSPKISETEPCAYKVTGVTKNKKETLKGREFVNSGIYMFTPEVFLSEFKKQEHDIYKIISKTDFTAFVSEEERKLFEKINETSVEAILENSKVVAALPLDEIIKKASPEYEEYVENKYNTTGRTFLLEAMTDIPELKNKYAVLTENDIFIEDAIISDNYNYIADKEYTPEYKPVERPWGYYTVLNEGKGFLTKCITVNPSQKLSLQLHHHRKEHWLVLQGEATVIKGNDIMTLNPEDTVFIDKEEIHSLQNKTNEQIKILEIQEGDILDENDIVRLEDIYGRV